MIVTVLRLDEERLIHCWQSLCLLDRNAFDNDSWSREDFERQLPDKFELSRIASLRGKVLGYLIASTYGYANVHIHRFVVSEQFRRKGIGTAMLTSFEQDCLKRHLTRVTLESLRDRRAANSFYERMRFRRIRGEDLMAYLCQKGKTAIAEKYDPLSMSAEVLVYMKSIG